MEPKQKQHPIVDVTGVESKVQCYNQQYCIGTWKFRSMNQAKLEVFRKEMAIIYTTMGKNPLEEWSSHHSHQKGPKCSTWMQSHK